MRKDWAALKFPRVLMTREVFNSGAVEEVFMIALGIALERGCSYSRPLWGMIYWKSSRLHRHQLLRGLELWRGGLTRRYAGGDLGFGGEVEERLSWVVGILSLLLCRLGELRLPLRGVCSIVGLHSRLLLSLRICVLFLENLAVNATAMKVSYNLLKACQLHQRQQKRQWDKRRI
jgi:hypothetical protein